MTIFTDEEIPAEVLLEGIEAYCAKCKHKHKMLSPRTARVGPDGKMLGYIGECPNCGRNLFRFRGRMKLEGTAYSRLRERRIEARRAKLLDRVPTITASYWGEVD